MLHYFIVQFLTKFVNETLAAQVGSKLFKNKVTIIKTGPDGTLLQINLCDTAQYEVTIKKVV